jgi:2'-hydroxyisoflavone reductase
MRQSSFAVVVSGVFAAAVVRAAGSPEDAVRCPCMATSRRRLLVLGGTAFVGRAVAAAATAVGHDVVTVNRGRSGPDVEGVQVVHADRTDHVALAAALSEAVGAEGVDVVIDTWSGAPLHAAAAARLLADRTDHYVYVSSRSV